MAASYYMGDASGGSALWVMAGGYASGYVSSEGDVGFIVFQVKAQLA